MPLILKKETANQIVTIQRVVLAICAWSFPFWFFSIEEEEKTIFVRH